MPSKEFHLNRIKELKFQRDIKINKDNRNHNTLIASISIIVIFLLFEYSKKEKRMGWIIFFAIAFFILIWAINREVYYAENKIIQRNLDAIFGRKK
jgi:hypothetical protein